MRGHGKPSSPEGLCVEAVFFSPFQPLFRSPQTWMRQIAAVASRHCCNFTDAVTCPGRSTKLFAFQCRKHSPVSHFVTAPNTAEPMLPLPPAGNVVWNDLWIQRASDSLLNIACRGKGDSCIMSKPTGHSCHSQHRSTQHRTSNQSSIKVETQRPWRSAAGGFRMTATRVAAKE